MKALSYIFPLLLLAGGSCGSSDVELASDRDGGEIGDNVDAATPGECVPDGTECNNCVDDDADGFIDGFDPECTGILDNDESSFATDIPGDNRDAVKQDCFFDGDSGSGNDGCELHVCCFLEPFVNCCEGNETPAEDGCLDFTGPKYDPQACTPSEQCVAACEPLTPAGCDCFGCCTVCNGSDCRDILTNPGVYETEDCSQNSNPSEGECCEAEQLDGCYSCTKSASCGPSSCNDNPEDCVLCPGQVLEDLPDTCQMQECPQGAAACALTSDCGDEQYCNRGCCTSTVIID